MLRTGLLCDAIEEPLMSLLGVDRYHAIRRAAASMSSMARASAPWVSWSASPTAPAAAQFSVGVLQPVCAVILLYTSVPSFTRVWQVMTEEQRLGVEMLDPTPVAAAAMPSQHVDERIAA